MNKSQNRFSLSAGVRVFYNGMFDIAEWQYDGVYDPYENNILLCHGFGIGAYFDAACAEIGMDFLLGSFKPGSTTYTGDYELRSTHFGFSLLGKYPVALGRTTVFPLLGIDYQWFTSGEANEGGSGIDVKRDELGDEDWYDIFSIVVGGGVDYNLNAKLYLRGKVLLNFKMDGSREDFLRGTGDVISLFQFGPRISVGVGCKL
ncbi:MAG: hypothetical protein MdMp014T_0668 [Treponematales bacterium]